MGPPGLIGGRGAGGSGKRRLSVTIAAAAPSARKSLPALSAGSSQIACAWPRTSLPRATAVWSGASAARVASSQPASTWIVSSRWPRSMAPTIQRGASTAACAACPASRRSRTWAWIWAGRCRPSRRALRRARRRARAGASGCARAGGPGRAVRPPGPEREPDTAVLQQHTGDRIEDLRAEPLEQALDEGAAGAALVVDRDHGDGVAARMRARRCASTSPPTTRRSPPCSSTRRRTARARGSASIRLRWSSPRRRSRRGAAPRPRGRVSGRCAARSGPGGGGRPRSSAGGEELAAAEVTARAVTSAGIAQVGVGDRAAQRGECVGDRALVERAGAVVGQWPRVAASAG